MNNKNFNSLSQLKEHKKAFKFSSEDIFLDYLSKIYINYSKEKKQPLIQNHLKFKENISFQNKKRRY